MSVQFERKSLSEASYAELDIVPQACLSNRYVKNIRLYIGSVTNVLQEIETWVEALSYYDNNEFENSLRVFDNIADTSKILFNCGVIHATIGEHDRAVCTQ